MKKGAAPPGCGALTFIETVLEDAHQIKDDDDRDRDPDQPCQCTFHDSPLLSWSCRRRTGRGAARRDVAMTTATMIVPTAIRIMPLRLPCPAPHLPVCGKNVAGSAAVPGDGGKSALRPQRHAGARCGARFGAGEKDVPHAMGRGAWACCGLRAEGNSASAANPLFRQMPPDRPARMESAMTNSPSSTVSPRRGPPVRRGGTRLALVVFAVCYALACAVTLMPREAWAPVAVAETRLR